MHGLPRHAKITQMFSRKWLAVPLVGSALALSACGGGPAFGDVEGQVLAMRSAAEQPALLKDASVLIAGNGIDCGKRADFCAAKSDANGKYGFKDVPAGTYAIAFNTPGSGDVKLQEETRQFSVSANAVARDVLPEWDGPVRTINRASGKGYTLPRLRVPSA